MKVVLLIAMLVGGACAQQVIQILPNDEVSLRNAKAISVGTGGLIYIADSGHHRVVAVDSTGKLVAESGFGGSSGAQMLWPVDVSATAGAYVYVVDAGNKRILKFSRLLESQGEFEILSNDGQALEPRLIAASPQGDVFVYESDEGQILRYDPLFTLQNRLGAASGRDFVQAPVQLTHSDAYGVMWIDRDGTFVHESDRYLSAEQKIPAALENATDIAASDSNYWLANERSVICVGGNAENRSVVFKDVAGMSDVGSVTCAPYGKSALYVLDRHGGRLFRITFAE